MEEVDGKADFTKPELRVNPEDDPQHVQDVVEYEVCVDSCGVIDVLFIAETQKVDVDDLKQVEGVPGKRMSFHRWLCQVRDYQ